MLNHIPAEANMHTENPAPLVDRVFARIAATRMAGLALNNPALRVEARGFRAWQGLWLGVLITPWAINLMLLPGGNPDFRRLGPAETQRWSFPSGEYEFLGGDEPGLGAYQICSLFSPAFEFAGHDAARAVARAALAALLASGEGPVAAQRERARLEGRPLLDRPMSRRAFFGGLLPGQWKV